MGESVNHIFFIRVKSSTSCLMATIINFDNGIGLKIFREFQVCLGQNIQGEIVDLSIDPNWHETGHFPPACSFWIRFCQLNFFWR